MTTVRSPLVLVGGKIEELPSGDVILGAPSGPQGAAATVAVGTTTTGAAGSSASVTNSGSTSAAVLNFTIPKGDTGATGPAGAASLLAVVAYQGSGGDTTYTTASTTFADVDATNLKITFTAPASGNVLVRVTLPCISNSAGNGSFFNLRESTTNIGMALVTSSTQIVSATAVFYVTGVSAGSHTYKLGWRCLSGTFTLFYGSATRGPIVMEAYAAP